MRTLRREWRSGELGVLAAALVIAVASLTAVGVFTDRMDRAMRLGAADLLAADLVVASTEPLPDAYAAQARARGLAVARTLGFRSAVMVGEGFELTAIKAVGEGYPLRGRLGTADVPFGLDRVERSGPPRGEAWLESRLFDRLGVAPGDRIELGEATLVASRALTYEPDRGGELFSIAPRLMMHVDDVPATGLVQPASRVRHRLLLAGSEAAVADMRAWLAERLETSQELRGVRDARPAMRVALDRAGRFLGLASLVAVLLAGVAIALAAGRHATRHLDDAAILRCLGASQRTVVGIYGLALLGLGVLASLAGVGLGFAGQAALAHHVGTLIVSALPPPSLAPALGGVVVGLVLLAGFALPPIVALREVPPARVIRRETAAPGRGGAAGLYLSATVAGVALVLWQAADLELAAVALGGGALTIAILLAGAAALVFAAGRLRGRVGVSWRFGLANIARRGRSSRLQVVAFGLGIALLLLLTLVRTDLLRSWQDNLPPGAPNYFLINIAPDETDRLAGFLADHGLAGTALHPMVRGRLVGINGREVGPEDYPNPRAQRLASRDFNLSFGDTLGEDNRIVAGQWWPSGAAPEPLVSIEQGIGETLGFGLGDRLTFLIAGERVSARIASVRTVQWDSFEVNFFVIFAPGAIEDRPATYISAFHLDPARREVLRALVREFPSVTVLDVNALLTKIREIMEQASLGIQVVFGFTLAAGLMVLFAAIASTVDERRYETAVVRTLGASRGRLLAGLIAEFVALGLLAGTLGAIAASAVGFVVSLRVLDLPYAPDPWIGVLGVAGGVVGVGLAGVLATRRVLDHPPIATLRRI